MSAPPYDELERAWKALRLPGVTAREVACSGVFRTLLVVDVEPRNSSRDRRPGANARGGLNATAVIMTAGVHGDEPAGPWALLSIVRDGLLDRDFAYRLWPCTNPSGYELRTRTNAEGIDVNRSFGRGGKSVEARAMMAANGDMRFALNLDLHEDFEADGFYCYEPRVDDVSFGPAIVRAMDEAGLPVQDLHDEYELGYPPEAVHIRALERGRVIPDVRAETEHMAGGLPHSIFLLRRAVHRSLTFESPACLRWEDRIAMHRLATVTALERLRSASFSTSGLAKSQ